MSEVTTVGVSNEGGGVDDDDIDASMSEAEKLKLLLARLRLERDSAMTVGPACVINLLNLLSVTLQAATNEREAAVKVEQKWCEFCDVDTAFLRITGNSKTRATTGGDQRHVGVDDRRTQCCVDGVCERKS
jgi:hypothetical protein